MSTMVVTDSTAYLPPGIGDGLPIRVVPLHVIMGDTSGADGIDVLPADVVAALADRSVQVSTSRPAPSHFVEVYRDILYSGYDQIVSVHLSSELSGTWDAARLAAMQCNTDAGAEVVRVVDSRVTAMALGFPVLVAARLAAAGGSVDEVYEAAVAALSETYNFFYVDSLEYLRRGGRIGTARAWLGTALSVKPILHLEDGRIVPLEKVRTATRAIARLEELVVEAAAKIDGEVLVAVHHLASPDRAEALRAAFAERIGNAREIVVSEVGAVLGAHAGPGLLAAVVVPALT